ncbi:uncharacterized protein LOC115454456 isoform X1 [Manduca sexta]|uniref:uncharacterized protein LOC115454456 isoform X1 n=1 Tax=Manduca sexta TaxID=7130 RepID=UPI00188F3076|nr:uncharacterized protein LOC115454456 isoform X1 [Manduca sexta]
MAPPKYIVVKFLDKKDGDNFAFVPESWVEADRPTDNTIVIYYPTEDKIAIENRVKNNEQPRADWNQYLCELLHTTNRYGDAKIDTMKKNLEAKEKPAAKNEGVKGEKRRCTLSSNSAPKQSKRPTINNAHTSAQSITEPQCGTIVNPSPHVVGPMVNFFIPIGDFVCNLQVPTQLLDLANEYTKPGSACNTAKKEGPNIALKQQTKIDEYVGKTVKMNESNMMSSDPDHEGTRWTLRHPRPGPGLVELCDNSKVYVNGDQLRRYTAAAATSRNLVRTLLSLVFTEEALSICTLTRKKSQLDMEAIYAMFKYVGNVGSQRKWGDVDIQYLNECVRQKLQEIRRRTTTKSYTQG